MTEYGAKLIEAAHIELRRKLGVFPVVPNGKNASVYSAASHSALLAFLDKLLSEGPSDAMVRAYVSEVSGIEPDDPDFGGHAHDARTAFEDMSAMIRSLRSEIAEESGR